MNLILHQINILHTFQYFTFLAKKTGKAFLISEHLLLFFSPLLGKKGEKKMILCCNILILSSTHAANTMLSMTPWNRNLRLNVPKLSQFKLLHCQKGFSSVWWVGDSTVSEECCSAARWWWLLLSAKTCREHFHPLAQSVHLPKPFILALQ